MNFPSPVKIHSNYVKTIFLEDRGQLFRAFDIDATGHIFRSHPEGCPWIGWLVTNNETIDSGDYVKLQRGLDKIDLIYPCLMVRHYGR